MPLPPLARFGDVLRNYRLMRGLSVEQLAAAANIAPSALRSMEANKIYAPSEETLAALIQALQLGKDERRMFEGVAKFSSVAFAGVFQSSKETDALTPPTFNASILAFLIADVRGYTHFTQTEGDEAAARLAARFADIARSAAERWDGHLLELRGDEALLIFGSLRQALHAALLLQSQFESATQEQPDIPLQVGIGLDVGEAVLVENGYRGVALNRAARLCSLAGAGEILVTTGLVYVASKVEGVAFQEHGHAQLKGFDTPMEIMRVVPAPQTSDESTTGHADSA
jgi:class 3 adenylate cyclase/DNA-binding XRE family transcriptional regulator